MEVYLVPIGGDEYELYFEDDDDDLPDAADEVAPADTEPPAWYRRPWAATARLARTLMTRFREMLSQAERERRQGYTDPEPTRWTGRLQLRGRRWIAESIAEQRLLWHLRRQTAASLYYPDDLAEGRAREIVRAMLVRDFDRHRFWLIVDSLLFVGSAALALLPGPNVVAYYFGFRMVGHYLSLRGAGQGLRAVAWTHEATPPLTALRRAIALEPEQRVRHVRDVAIALDLEHLPTFFERTAC